MQEIMIQNTTLQQQLQHYKLRKNLRSLTNDLIDSELLLYHNNHLTLNPLVEYSGTQSNRHQLLQLLNHTPSQNLNLFN